MKTTSLGITLATVATVPALLFGMSGAASASQASSTPSLASAPYEVGTHAVLGGIPSPHRMAPRIAPRHFYRYAPRRMVRHAGFFASSCSRNFYRSFFFSRSCRNRKFLFNNGVVDDSFNDRSFNFNRFHRFFDGHFDED